MYYLHHSRREEKGMSNLIRIEKGRAIVSLNLVGWRTIGKEDPVDRLMFL